MPLVVHSVSYRIVFRTEACSVAKLLTVVVDKVKKSGVRREINMHAANIKWLFVMNRETSANVPVKPVNIVVQVDSVYGYRLVTLRSPVQVVYGYHFITLRSPVQIVYSYCLFTLRSPCPGSLSLQLPPVT